MSSALAQYDWQLMYLCVMQAAGLQQLESCSQWLPVWPRNTAALVSCSSPALCVCLCLYWTQEHLFLSYNSPTCFLYLLFATDVESCYLYKEGYVFVLFWFVCWFVCVTDWLIEKLINCPMTQSQAANFSSVITLSDQQLSNQTFYFIIHLRLVPVFKRLTLR